MLILVLPISSAPRQFSLDLGTFMEKITKKLPAGPESFRIENFLFFELILQQFAHMIVLHIYRFFSSECLKEGGGNEANVSHQHAADL